MDGAPGLERERPASSCGADATLGVAAAHAVFPAEAAMEKSIRSRPTAEATRRALWRPVRPKRRTATIFSGTAISLRRGAENRPRLFPQKAASFCCHCRAFSASSNVFAYISVLSATMREQTLSNAEARLRNTPLSFAEGRIYDAVIRSFVFYGPVTSGFVAFAMPVLSFRAFHVVNFLLSKTVFL